MSQRTSRIKKLHSLPGRVRYKMSALRENPRLAEALRQELLRSDGVTWVRTNPLCASLAVGYLPAKTGEKQIRSLLERFSSLCAPAAAAAPASAPCRSDGACASRHPMEGEERSVRRAALRFVGLSLVMIGVFVRSFVLKLPLRQALFSPLGILAAVATYPLFKKSFQDLRERRFGLDGFLAASILTAVAMGEALTALEVLWIDSGAEFLKSWISRRSRRAISEILQVTGKNTFISLDGQEVEVPVDRVQPGDLVVLHTDEKISVDGIVESGKAMVDQSPINGISEFVLRQKGDAVLAGTLVREGVIFVRAQKVGDDTYLARVFHLVEMAQENQAPVQGVADRLALRLLKLGGALTLGTLLVTASFWRAFTVLLVMACPCATVLSASAPISAALNAAARRRILIKGGRYLEEVGETDVVCFDKTGTLSMSMPALREINNLSDLDDDQLLELACTAEMHNYHPLAMAIKDEAARKGLRPTGHVVCQYQLGEGVTARLNGKSIYVGNRRFMRRHRIRLGRTGEKARAMEKRGLAVAFLALSGEILGVLGFANQIRPEAKKVMRRLSEDGVERLVMITGEERRTAEGLALELGMDEFHCSVLPEDKARIVAGLKEPGRRVLMVGDGINDAFALTEAQVGIAMGAGGSEVAIEAADIALVDDNLEGIVYLRGLSRSTMRVVQQNFWIATGSNLVGMALGALGLLSPLAAGFLHIAHTLGILANSSRLLNYRAPALERGEPAGLLTGRTDAETPSKDAEKTPPAGRAGGRRGFLTATS